jgi:hypothetical protein
MLTITKCLPEYKIERKMDATLSILKHPHRVYVVDIKKEHHGIHLIRKRDRRYEVSQVGHQECLPTLAF